MKAGETDHEARPDTAMSEDPVGSPQRMRAYLVLASILVTGLAVRCFQLTGRSLWFDESFCWGVSQFSWIEAIRRVGMDNHPPLYFVLLKTWIILFGESVLAMRGLSVLLGVLTVWGMYLFSVEAFRPNEAEVRSGGSDRRRAGPSTRGGRGRLIGLMTAALVAASPFLIRWSQEVRMYTLATCLVAFSSWLLFRAIHQPDSDRRWVLFALTSLALAYTHYYGLFTVAAQFVYLWGYWLAGIWRARRERRNESHTTCTSGAAMSATGVALSTAIVLAGFLPWVPTLLDQRAQVQADYWLKPLDRWAIPNAIDQVSDLVPCEHGETTALLTTGLFGLVLVALLWRAGEGEAYLLTAVAVPLLMCTLITLFDTRIFLAQHLYGVHLFLLTSLAAVLSRIRPWQVGATVVLLLTCNGIGAR
ncbi:MAG: glycosyltransferase family 39 protein, partial [Planctomycetia bacterium]|nr:glycosyltransferase family 39 protein [Planctomycetia bacterium]